MLIQDHETEPAAGDFHLYATPDQLVSQFNKFDNITTPHIIGEMAAVIPNGGGGWNGVMMPWPWWGGAVGEAVSLLGYERNQDRIIGAAYVSNSLSNRSRVGDGHFLFVSEM